MVDLAARYGNRSYQEYLLKILNGELECRKQSRIARLLNEAGFPRRYEPEQFVPNEVIFPDDAPLKDLLDLSFYQRGRNVIMYGATGTGKTMLSILLGMAACRQGIPVRFFRTAALINQLAEAKHNMSLTALKRKLDPARILILDEFGYVPYDRAGSQLLFDYVSEIHEKKSIILNTNLEFAQWTNVLFDNGMTTAFVGRLTHHCDMILFPGSNHRLKESSVFEAYTKMAALQGKPDQAQA